MREEIIKSIGMMFIDLGVWILPEGLFKLKLKVFIKNNIKDL